MSLLNNFRKHTGKLSYKDEILEHLCDLLNTKKKFGSYPIDLGLDSYIYLGTDRKIILQIMADIKTCFGKYEKRISQVDIVHVPNQSSFYLSFMIHCKIENKPWSFRLAFNQKNYAYHLEVKE